MLHPSIKNSTRTFARCIPHGENIPAPRESSSSKLLGLLKCAEERSTSSSSCRSSTEGEFQFFHFYALPGRRLYVTCGMRNEPRNAYGFFRCQKCVQSETSSFPPSPSKVSQIFLRQTSTSVKPSSSRTAFPLRSSFKEVSETTSRAGVVK